jgi:hypothetical protein
LGLGLGFGDGVDAGSLLGAGEGTETGGGELGGV